MSHLSMAAVLVLSFVVNSASSAQSPSSLVARAAAEQGDTFTAVLVEDTPLVSLADLSTAPLVVRGTLVNPRSFLSADQHHIYTEYDLIPNHVVVERHKTRSRVVPGPAPLRVTLDGGTIMLGGKTITVRDLSTKAITSGAEVLLFLVPDPNLNGQLRPFGGSAGMFHVSAKGTLTALRRKGDGERGIESQSYDRVAQNILAFSKR